MEDAVDEQEEDVLLEYGEQVGTASWGEGCARPQFPGIYTQVSWFSAEIKKAAAALEVTKHNLRHSELPARIISSIDTLPALRSRIGPRRAVWERRTLAGTGKQRGLAVAVTVLASAIVAAPIRLAAVKGTR